MLRSSSALTELHCLVIARHPDVSVGMFLCCGGSLSPVVLMQVHQCQGCSRGHVTLNTEWDAVSCDRCCDDVTPARVPPSACCDVRGKVHSFAELERLAFKMGGVSFGANLKLLRMIDRRSTVSSFPAPCPNPSTMTKMMHETHTDIKVWNIRCEVQSALLSQRFTVTVVHCSP